MDASLRHMKLVMPLHRNQCCCIRASSNSTKIRSSTRCHLCPGALLACGGRSGPQIPAAQHMDHGKVFEAHRAERDRPCRQRRTLPRASTPVAHTSERPAASEPPLHLRRGLRREALPTTLGPRLPMPPPPSSQEPRRSKRGAAARAVHALLSLHRAPRRLPTTARKSCSLPWTRVTLARAWRKAAVPSHPTRQGPASAARRHQGHPSRRGRNPERSLTPLPANCRPRVATWPLPKSRSSCRRRWAG
mmetsp:Transcript_119648/g.338731  ORF Transcript_119648/g.338731 Transcript_119648/m.338731 type:complete len:247 (-) Transcript_119648:1258-1998(-)